MLKSFLLFLCAISMVGCAYKIDLKQPNHNVIDGWASGFIDSVGLGMYGSPAANGALSNGREEVLNNICAGRNVKFSPVSPSKTTVHSIGSIDMGYGNTLTTGTSTEVTIARGYTFICEDTDIKSKTYVLDDNKLVCKEILLFAPGEERIAGVKKNPETMHCDQYPGWYRVLNLAQNPHDLFFTSEGKFTCEKLLEEIAEEDIANTTHFLLKKLKSCNKNRITNTN